MSAEQDIPTIDPTADQTSRVSTAAHEAGGHGGPSQAISGSAPSRGPVPVDDQSSTCPGRKGPVACRGSLSIRRHSRINALRLASILLAVSLVLAVFFVLGDVLERHCFPDLSTSWHHGSLTLRAALVAITACLVVYFWMRRHQRDLSATAEQLTRRLEFFSENAVPTGRFENPHLVHCREVLKCEHADCPMYDSPGERCWQVMALSGAAREQESQAGQIHFCHECAVYRLSCPDKLTELGESFNNLMFLLEEEADKVGQMRAQMVEKEKMAAIGQIASGIAHEIGNPLSSISSIVQMLKRSRANGSVSEQLDLIQTHIQRISAIVRQLVSLARPTVERWELADVRQILDETIRLIGFDHRARKVEIDYEPPESLPPTYGLAGELQQVFINLTLNALDAMPDGGRLTIRAGRRRGAIVIRVQDNGCGIPADKGQRIFEPFFTTKEPGEGTGLGLAVSYGIVQKHGGTIDFTSEPDKGTEFVVRIPILEKAPGK